MFRRVWAVAACAALGPIQTASAQSPASAHVVVGTDGFAIESVTGDFRLQIGLLLHADARFVPDDDSQQVIDTFAVRRLRPYLRGQLSRWIEFFLDPDFANGTLVVQDAYVDTVISPAVRIRAGKGKTPFGMERLHSGSNLLFFSRALPTEVAPNRDVGIQVLGDLRGGFVSYLAGVMNGVADGGSGDVDTNDGKDVSGRVVVRPFSLAPKSAFHGLGLALSGSAGTEAGASALPSFKTTSVEHTFFSYATGAVADGSRIRYSPQIFFFNGPFGAWAEYVHSRVPVTRAGVTEDIAHRSWQVAGSWVLTGESATDASAGLRPRAAFDPSMGQWGAFQLAARIHALDVDARAVELGFAAPGSSRQAEAWTAGLNWYLTQNLRYTFNFERTIFDDDADGARKPETAFVFRTQLAF